MSPITNGLIISAVQKRKSNYVHKSCWQKLSNSGSTDVLARQVSHSFTHASESVFICSVGVLCAGLGLNQLFTAVDGRHRLSFAQFACFACLSRWAESSWVALKLNRHGRARPSLAPTLSVYIYWVLLRAPGQFCAPATSRTIIGLLTICLLLWPIKVRAWPVKAAGESNPMTSRSETAANQTLSQLKGLGKSPSLLLIRPRSPLVENREQLTACLIGYFLYPDYQSQNFLRYMRTISMFSLQMSWVMLL